MSRWFPDTVSLTLASPAQAEASSGERWAGALQQFEQELDTRGYRPGTRVDCSVGTEFARLRIVPWRDEFAERSAREAFVRHCFEEAYGAAAQAWTCRYTQARHGVAALACALDTALLDRLREVLQARRLRLHRVQPVLMQAYNRHRKALPTGPFWFVLEDGAWLTLLMMTADEPCAVRSLRAPLVQLDALLARESSLLGLDGSLWPVFITTPFGGVRNAASEIVSLARPGRVHEPASTEASPA